MRYGILWLVLLLSLTACQLSVGSSSGEATLLPPSATQAQQATTPGAATATKTVTPQATNTPPKVSTSIPLPSCTRQTTWPTYIVVSGDTLSKIANRTASDVATLVSANCLANADQISVGQTLYVPRQPTPPTQPPTDNGFVVSTLPANPACYLQIYGMMGSAIVRTAPDSTSNSLGTVTMQFYYRIYSQTPTHYEIAYNTQGQTGWIEKTGGSSVGDCRVLTQAPATPVTLRYSGVAFDYPSNWYSSFNIDGLPGGFVGTLRPSEMPNPANAWTNDMVMVGFTLVPDGIIGPDLETAAREAVENIRTGSSFTIVQEVTPFTTASGISGFVFDYTGQGTGARTYYLRVNDKNVVIGVNGNRALGEAVVNTLRAG